PATVRRVRTAGAKPKEIPFQPQSEFPATAEANVGSPSKSERKLVSSAGDASRRLRKMRAAKQGLGEGHEPVQLAVSKSRASHIGLSRKTLWNMADVGAEI